MRRAGESGRCMVVRAKHHAIFSGISSRIPAWLSGPAARSRFASDARPFSFFPEGQGREEQKKNEGKRRRINKSRQGFSFNTRDESPRVALRVATLDYLGSRETG